MLNEDQLKNIALLKIQKILESNGRSLSKWPEMPKPEDFDAYDGNRLIDDERRYKPEEKRVEEQRLLGMITDEQRGVYEEILDAVLNNKGGMFFLYGFGGTGKTFIWSLLSASIRSRGKIVINTASSGIAALLLEGGRTAHSRFVIPINADEFTTCNMTPGSDIAELMKAANLMIWDEAPMMSKHCFESLDRSLRDIMPENSDKPFGGKVIVFGGDFRQILPVIPGGGRGETVMANINSSDLWYSCRLLRLTKNMRLLAGLTDEQAEEQREFSEWILAVGDGKINTPNDGIVEIDIPEDLLISKCGDPIETIVEQVYGHDFHKIKDAATFYKSRAILSPTNEDVDKINDYMLSLIPGKEKEYLSSDSIQTADKDPTETVVYPMDFLNSIKVSELPNHNLKLKVGAIVMCLRNINPKGGLCNGTRLIVTQLGRHAVEGVILTGNDDVSGQKVLIPRMYVTPPENKFPFRMRRRQFPLTLAFAMTINKSQGQSLENVGIFLPRPCFSHGQLYVALSRVKSRSGLKILILDGEGKVQKKTTNVVYKEVFYKLRVDPVLQMRNQDDNVSNDDVLSVLPGPTREYLCVDNIIIDIEPSTDGVGINMELVNSIMLQRGFPKICLKLRIGARVMCLCDIDQSLGILKGTTMIVTTLGTNLIEVKHVKKNEELTRQYSLIPRMYFTSHEDFEGFKIIRKQFPLMLLM